MPGNNPTQEKSQRSFWPGNQRNSGTSPPMTHPWDEGYIILLICNKKWTKLVGEYTDTSSMDPMGPLKLRVPPVETNLPTINFQEQTTSFREGRVSLDLSKCSIYPFLNFGLVQSSVISHHNITTARKPSTDLVPYHPLWSTRPSYLFFSIRMSNYIHAITCIIIYMGILLMQIQNTPPLNHSSPKKTPSPPNNSKKTSPGCFLKSSPKKSPNQFFSGLSEAGRISLKFWVKRQLKATISTWLGWKVDAICQSTCESVWAWSELTWTLRHWREPLFLKRWSFLGYLRY